MPVSEGLLVETRTELEWSGHSVKSFESLIVKLYSQSYFAARRPLIEGPGKVDSGAWPISWYRIAKGWGQLPYAFWPDQENVTGDTMPGEPPNADEIAKRDRLKHYQRVRNEYECLYALSTDRPVAASIEISKAWTRDRAKGGHLDLNAADDIVFVHSIGLTDINFGSQEIEFPNSWGEQWGDEGWGYLPFGYLNKFMTEAWISNEFEVQTCPAQPGIHFRWAKGQSSALGETRILEVLDGDKDNVAAWALIVAKAHVIDVEDFFVRPDYRRRGIGKQMKSAIVDFITKAKRPIRFWIPWGDHAEFNAANLLGWANSLKLTIKPSGVRWAAYLAEPGEPVNELPQLEWIPQKATSSLLTLEATDISIELEEVDEVDWTDAHASRRAELIDKEYQSFLTAEEEEELESLQEAFGRYQDQNFPLE